MNVKLKKLSDQVIVITGASSGIGLVTARMAAKRGARLILNARNEATLQRVCDEIIEAGGEAYHVAGDVGQFDDVQNIANEAIDRFGGFDTWVNNAGVSIYGPVLDQSLEDQRRLFDTNYWGVVHGSMVACAHLRKRGGTLINVGSVLSDVAIPIQGTYCATKHAVKGYTDALRLELEEDGAPISVSLWQFRQSRRPALSCLEHHSLSTHRSAASIVRRVVSRRFLPCESTPLETGSWSRKQPTRRQVPPRCLSKHFHRHNA